MAPGSAGWLLVVVTILLVVTIFVVVYLVFVVVRFIGVRGGFRRCLFPPRASSLAAPA